MAGLQRRNVVSKAKLEPGNTGSVPASDELNSRPPEPFSEKNDEILNSMLLHVNETLRESESNLEVTLNSIGDAVIDRKSVV